MELFTGYIREPFYYETDQIGIIHHSNYIRWLEESRVALLDYLGFSYKKIEELGLIIPVLEVTCQYKEMVPLWRNRLYLTENREVYGHSFRFHL